MNLKRTVRTVDNVFEYLIFDLMLGTAKRRQIVAAMTLSVSAVLYAASGLLFVPEQVVPRATIDSLPYVADSTWKSPSAVIWDTLLNLKVSPANAPGLADELERHEDALKRALEALSRPQLASCQGVPDYRNVRELGNLLIARGIYLDSVGNFQEALDSWIAAMRLGRVMAASDGDRSALIPGLIGCAIEKKALLAMIDFAKRRLTHERAFQILHELGLRGASMGNTELLTRSEMSIALENLDRGLVGASLFSAEHEPRFFRTFMPVREADRLAFLREVRVHAAREAERVMGNLHGNTASELPDLSDVSDVTSIVPALFSRDRAARLCGRALVWFTLPNFKAVCERLDKRDKSVEELRHLCALQTL